MSALLRNLGSPALRSGLEISLLSVRSEETEASATHTAQDATANPGSGYSGIDEHSAPFHSFLEYAMSFMFPVLFILNLYFSLARLYELERLWLVALTIPLGLLASDFVTGMLHWAADTYGSENTLVVGPSLIKPFRLHHIYPRDICTHNLVMTVGNACILAVPVLSFCLYVMWVMPAPGWLALIMAWAAVLAGTTVATNQFHKWAHQESPSGLARWLQRTRLVLEPAHHRLHHTAPYNMHYCITNGWLNPILNRIKFFRRLEGALRFLGIETTQDRMNQ